jgi:hypothetical protein
VTSAAEEAGEAAEAPASGVNGVAVPAALLSAPPAKTPSSPDEQPAVSSRTEPRTRSCALMLIYGSYTATRAVAPQSSVGFVKHDVHDRHEERGHARRRRGEDRASASFGRSNT